MESNSSASVITRLRQHVFFQAVVIAKFIPCF